MNASRLRLLGTIALGLAACTGCPPAGSSGGAAPPATNKEKIVGKWELVKGEQGWPAGATWEFSKDGKATVDLGIAKPGGAYEVNGDALQCTPEGKGANALTIKELTDAKLVVADDKGKTNEFKKQGGARDGDGRPERGETRRPLEIGEGGERYECRAAGIHWRRLRGEGGE